MVEIGVTGDSPGERQMTIDLDALGKIIAGFTKTQFRAIPGGDDGDGYDEIEAVVNGGERHAFADVYSDDCAAPVVEILNAAPDLIQLARLGQAQVKMRIADRAGYVNWEAIYAHEAAYANLAIREVADNAIRERDAALAEIDKLKAALSECCKLGFEFVPEGCDVYIQWLDEWMALAKK